MRIPLLKNFLILTMFCFGIVSIIIFLPHTQGHYNSVSTLDLGINCYIDQTFIPILSNGDFSESEDNNLWEDADGPLTSEQLYTAKLGGNDDRYDIYYFKTPKLGSVTINLIDTAPTPGIILREHGVQVTIYSSTTGYKNIEHDKDYVTLIKTPPYSKTISAQKPWFVIMVFSDSKTVFSYEIQAIYPTLAPSEIPTNIPLPRCTATPTPSATPITLCDFVDLGAKYTILFPQGIIVADGEEVEAISTANNMPIIASGNYSVALSSFDDHIGKGYQDQPMESWYLRLKDSQGTIVATVGPSNDIIDAPPTNCSITYLDDVLILDQPIHSADAYHAAYSLGIYNNANSVNPDYALLIPVEMNKVAPTKTPSPPHRLTKTPTPPP